MDTDLRGPSAETIEEDQPQHDPLLRCRVIDAHGEDIGKVETAWQNTTTGGVEFIGVMTHWLTEKVLPVPLERAEVDTGTCIVRLPYSKDAIKNAPRLAQHGTLTQEHRAAIHAYFRLSLSRGTDGPTG